KVLAAYRAAGVTAAKPNYAQAVRLLNMSATAGDRAGAVAACADRLLDATGARIAAVTLDADGAVVLERRGLVPPTYAQPVPAPPPARATRSARRSRSRWRRARTRARPRSSHRRPQRSWSRRTAPPSARRPSCGAARPAIRRRSSIAAASPRARTAIAATTGA